MPNLNNKDREPLQINFSASHDQASIQDELALNHKNLNVIKQTLEKNQKDLQLNQINETKTEIINLVKYARQIVNDLQEGTKKLSTIQQHSSDEKLKHTKSLLATHKSLTANEKYRFKEIEEALSNTCIIKSAGDETIKFQLGILGYAKDSNIISEPEFNYLVVARLKDNNLLDSYRLRVKGDMILKQTSVEICQAINEALSCDPDYEDSKKLFVHRLNGINYELSLHHCNNPRDMVQLKEELTSGVPTHSGTHPSTQNFENHSEENLPPFPEVPDDSLELNSQQPFNETPININHTEEDKKKSEFVSIMEELMPANKKNGKKQIDEINPIPVEEIMQITLQRTISLSEDEIFKLNYKAISKIQEASTSALHRMQEQFKKSYSTDGSSNYEELERSCDASKKDRAENLKKPKPCKLTGQPLVTEYLKFGKDYLDRTIKKCQTEIENLEDSKKRAYGEFSKHNPKYNHLKNDERKKIMHRIYNDQETTLKTKLEKANKQQALWEGKKTFIQNVEINGKIKQEEKSFPEEELHFRNLVLDFNSNSASKDKTINVYSNGVYLVSNKKTEDRPSSIQISSNRTPFKNCIQGLTSSIFHAPNKKEGNPKLAMGKSLLRS